MFVEHPNGRMIEVDSSIVKFLKDQFLSVDEIKKDLWLYELQHDSQLSLIEGANLSTHYVTEDSFHSNLSVLDDIFKLMNFFFSYLLL